MKKWSLDPLFVEFQMIKGDYLFSGKEIRPVLFRENTENVKRKFGQVTSEKRRLAIFASFNKNAVIKDYVVYYLKELKKVVDGIVFIMDNPLMPGEIEKIKDYISYAECLRHGEYDFGSYKKGFLYLVNNNLLDNIDELVLCNDSCYGPLFPFENIFNEMNDKGKDNDFWGMSSNERIKYHLQSFFFVFKKNVFNHPCFRQFLAAVKEEKHAIGVIINYEVAFTNYLRENGYSSSAYLNYPLTELRIKNIEKDKCPLIKVKWLENVNTKAEKVRKRFDLIVRKVNPDLFNILKEQKK